MGQRKSGGSRESPRSAFPTKASALRPANRQERLDGRLLQNGTGLIYIPGSWKVARKGRPRWTSRTATTPLPILLRSENNSTT